MVAFKIGHNFEFGSCITNICLKLICTNKSKVCCIMMRDVSNGFTAQNTTFWLKVFVNFIYKCLLVQLKTINF